ncbi:hypothetical protein [Halapricum hydrolyticum]|uniref:Uncharacterized protein n=1 Tax=Halapricum hydrolyticum TaxID=2979991 RepID=A0AAE3IF57_9EURY|nr:hypothetical protein [Halapricum hydrolyticum]MCU4718332.1 hypothetical protein [Halapricum hydrolyticum]MCU4727220.1 hypothetical protein [Halapricum hydrolyticum]
MTSNPTFDGEIESPADFEAALHSLLVAALENGVNPGGSWEYRSDGLPSDWEVIVTELRSRDKGR